MEDSSSKTPAEPPAAAPVMESGEEQGETITIVTPKRDFVCHVQTEWTEPVEETCQNATAELVR